MKLFLLFSFLLLSACGGGNSSSETSTDTATTITGDGATVSFASTELVAGDAVELSYDLGSDELTGTIRWGDGRETRVRGSGTARHGYDNASTYSVSLQIDGEDSNRIGTIVVSLVSTSSSAQSNVSQIPFRVTFACSPSASDVQIRNPNTGTIYTLRPMVVASSSPRPTIQVSLTNGSDSTLLGSGAVCGVKSSLNNTFSVTLGAESFMVSASITSGQSPQITISLL